MTHPPFAVARRRLIPPIPTLLLAIVGVPGTTAIATDAANAAPVPELVGIQVGMTSEEAKQVLLQRQLRVDEDKQLFRGSGSSTTFTTLLKAYPAVQDTSKPRESIFVTIATPPSEPRVVSVARLITYPTKTGPQPESLLSAFTEKFGPPSQATDRQSRSILVWHWSADGKLSKPDKRRTCETFLGGFDFQGNFSVQPFTQDVRPDKFKRPLDAGCATGVRATVESINGQVTRVTSVAVDFAAADSTMTRTIEHMAQLKKSNVQKNREAASEVKPEI